MASYLNGGPTYFNSYPKKKPEDETAVKTNTPMVSGYGPPTAEQSTGMAGAGGGNPTRPFNVWRPGEGMGPPPPPPAV